MDRVKGKVALVTGGADGIGAATARLLAAEGATVVVTDINKEGAESLADELGGLGIAHDAGSEAEWHHAVRLVRERYGRLDVLVNNAGIGAGIGDIEHQTLEDYHKVMRVTCDSVFIGSKCAIELMKSEGGSIVNVSSIHGIKAAAHEAAYSAAKGAVRLLTKSVALHCARSGYRIRSNSVHPGYILTTQMIAWMERADNSADLNAALLAQHPIGFLGQPEDIANGILFLASEESRFMTGSELVIDGGYTL
ncbi:glucose 1-dehydrogenase [Emcibacter sp. SYSU 3D8]|uniref:glucose 1-dehydrogenase n=1 Tax=Emcibacter sp. SYSU 3D8 TaxID=3133969 RepID=UPI0031FF1331